MVQLLLLAKGNDKILSYLAFEIMLLQVPYAYYHLQTATKNKLIKQSNMKIILTNY